MNVDSEKNADKKKEVDKTASTKIGDSNVKHPGAHEAKEQFLATPKAKRLANILKVFLLLAIIIGVPLYLFLCQRDFLATFSDLDKVKDMAAQYKKEGVLIYIALQILQVVISIIPGQPLQITAGFMFGFFWALLFSLIGACLGTIITYHLGKWLGQDALHMFFGQERIARFVGQMNSKKAVTVVFLIYLVPGLPKDILSYAAGISDMKGRPFLLFSMVGRCPGMIASLLIGKEIYDGQYGGAIIVAAVAVFAFLLGVLFRKKLMAWFDKAYERVYLAEEKADSRREIRHEKYHEQWEKHHEQWQKRWNNHQK